MVEKLLPYAAAILAQAEPVEPIDTVDINYLDLVTHSGPVVAAVLILLCVFSVFSWAIILYKVRQLNRAARESVHFLDAFWKAPRLDDAYEKSNDFLHAPVAQVFRAGYVELSKVLKSQNKAKEGGASMMESLGFMETIQRALRRQAVSQITDLERLVPFLATCGSTAPFIGLFGTVWGIMGSFHAIGRMGSASLATVAPGISEALIATAAGLAAAIPAVIAYNYFINRIKVLDNEMENFSADFLNILGRHFAAVADGSTRRPTTSAN